MSHPVRMLRLAPLALVLVAVVAPARADDPQRAQRVTRVFPVADLVVPIEDYAAPPLSGPMTPACPAIQACPAAANCPAAPAQSCPTTPKCETACPSSKQTLQDKLISLIQNVVSPNSWSNVGGSGTIDYMPIGHGLVISQTPDVHEQVVDLLETLRRLQNHQVSFEVRLLTVAGDHFNEKLGLLVNPCRAGDAPMILTQEQVSQLVESLQGDRHVLFTQAPKLTVFNGQRASVRCVEEQFFVTKVNTTQVGAQSVCVPENTPCSLGYQVTVCPKLATDGRSVQCELRAEHAVLATPHVQLFPVTTFITPTFEGGAQGPPIPFTQFIQQPVIARNVVEKALTIPGGGTAVVYAGQRTRQEAAPPADESAPLFRWVLDLVEAIGPPAPPPPTVREHLFLMVTPHVIVNDEDVVQKPAPEVLPTPKVCRAPAEEEQSAPRPAPAAVPGCSACPVCSPLPPACCPMPPAGPPPACKPTPTADCQHDLPCQIMMNACILRLDPTFFDRPAAAAWADLSPKACAGKPCFLDQGEAQRFCRAVLATGCGEVLSCPKVMTLNDQTAAVNIGQDFPSVTGVMLVQRPDGTVAPEFQKTVRATGILMKLQPRVSADRKYIQLALSYEISRETAGAKEYRVTITPVGGQDDGRSRTETLRQPALHVHQIETTFSFPLNRAALVHCDGHVFLVVPSLVEPGTKEQPVPSPLAPCVPATPAQPAACPVPTVTPFTMAPAAPWPVPPAPIYYRAAVPVPTPMLPPQVRPVFEEQVAPPTQTPPADEKFRRVKKAVTAFQVQPPQMPPADVLRLRVLMDQSEELRQVRNAMLSALLAEYRAACAAGDTAAAAKLAARCLAIDPTCFGK